MSTSICPNGHPTTATDYCDTCGEPLSSAAGGTGGAAMGTGPVGAQPAAAAPAASATCPHCQTVNLPDALFCEACGYDFTTGALPRPLRPPPGPDAGSTPAAAAAGVVPASGGDPASLAPAVPLEWVVEVWVDPDWYAQQESEETCPSPGLPAVVPLTVRSVLVGRVSKSRNIHPEVDCDGDVGVSRRQAQLSTDGTRWWIEDLQSSNGTYVGAASGPLPAQALTPGQRRELAEDDRVYVGAWTRLVVRRATDDERSAAAPTL